MHQIATPAETVRHDEEDRRLSITPCKRAPPANHRRCWRESIDAGVRERRLLCRERHAVATRDGAQAEQDLIGIMPQHVDKLGVDFSITSLSPDHPRFWAQLAARTWRGEAPPSPEEIQGLVDGWTADRSAEQIMACLMSLWKDESTYTAGAWV